MLDWIKEIISSSIWDGIAGIIQSILDNTFSFIASVVLQPTEPGKYLTNFNEYLHGVQYFAGGLLVVFVVLAVFKQISGVMYSSDRSMGTYFIQVTFAGALIYLLPKIVTLIFLPINNALIGFIGRVGTDTSRIEASFQNIWGIVKEEKLITVIFLILLIAMFVMGIAGAIRYIETIIAILIAPLVALSIINNNDAINIWTRELIAIVFTQTIHFLLLQILISIIGGVQNLLIMMILAIGTIAVGLRGPQILRQYLYKTGTSSALVSSVGSVSRLGMIGLMVRR